MPTATCTWQLEHLMSMQNRAPVPDSPHKSLVDGARHRHGAQNETTIEQVPPAGPTRMLTMRALGCPLPAHEIELAVSPADWVKSLSSRRFRGGKHSPSARRCYCSRTSL